MNEKASGDDDGSSMPSHRQKYQTGGQQRQLGYVTIKDPLPRKVPPLPPGRSCKVISFNVNGLNRIQVPIIFTNCCIGC